MTNTDQLGRTIDQARTINTALLLAGLIGALLLGWWAPWAPTLADATTATKTVGVARPAAAQRPVYRGTVTICYAPRPARSDPDDQYLSRQWSAELAGAIRAAQPRIGRVRVVTERYPHTTCNGQVSLWSSPGAWANNPAKPYDVYRYGEAGVMWESQVTMGDKVGARSTAAQRRAWLTAALVAAIPR
jgi:hypothetical protein